MSNPQVGGVVLPDPQVVLQWAQYYAFTMRWVIMPITQFIGYAPDGRKVCSCELTGKKWNNCIEGKPGKHPWRKWRDIQTPEQGYAAFRSVFDERPYGAAIGVITGRISGLWALDLDMGAAKNGVADLEQWLGKNKLGWHDLETVSAQTGGGGYHFLYRYPHVDKITTVAAHKEFGQSVDIKGDGGYILVAPSVHASGNQYVWRSTLTPETLSSAPEKVVSLVEHRRKQPLLGGGATTYTPSLEELKEYADELSRKKGRIHEIGENMLFALSGNAIAEEGGAHDAYRDVMYLIAKRWPTSDAAEVLAYFTDSVTERFSNKTDASTDMSNLFDSMTTAIEKANAEAKEWTGQLALDKTSKPIAGDANLLLFFRHHPAWQGVFGYNLRRNRPVYLKKPPLSVVIEGDFEMSRDKTEIALWFQNQVKMSGKVLKDELLSAVLRASWDNAFDPLLVFVNGLRGKWDGVHRLDTALQRVAGTPDSAWVRLVFPTWFRSLVARILTPGCKADTMLILEGFQGFKKSTFFASLLPDKAYFSDSLNKIRHDVESLRLVHSGPAIFEIGELSGLRKQEVEDIKAFLSAFQDDLRPLYEAYRTTLRRCVFVGTTNRNDYLRDETGGRRFWPVEVTKTIDVALVLAEREQWFAEALAFLEAGWPWWLNGGSDTLLAQAEQNRRYEEDIWMQPIVDWLDGPRAIEQKNATNASEQMEQTFNALRPGDRVTTMQVATHALKLAIKDARSGEGFRINKIMKKLGWVQCVIEIGGTELDGDKIDTKKIRAWQRPQPTPPMTPLPL